MQGGVDMIAANGQAGPRLLVVAEPILVGAELAGRLCGVSGRTWTRMAASGEIPRPLRLGRLRRWSVDELRAWVAASCPSRERWQAMNKSALEPCQAGGRINKITHDDPISTKLRRQV